MYVVFLATSLTHYRPSNLSTKTEVTALCSPSSLLQSSGTSDHMRKHNYVSALRQMAGTVSELWYWHHCTGRLSLAKWFVPNPSISGRWTNAQAFLLAKAPVVYQQPSPRETEPLTIQHMTLKSQQSRELLRAEYISLLHPIALLAFFFGSLPISGAGSTACWGSGVFPKMRSIH